MNSNPSEIFYYQCIYTHAPQMNTLETLNDPYKQVISAGEVDDIPYHTKIHKVNDNVAISRHSTFPEHVPIQKWDIQ